MAEFDGALQFPFGDRPVPPVEEFIASAHEMGVGQVVVERQCFFDERQGRGSILLRRASNLSERQVRISQADIGEGVPRVSGKCLIEVVDTLPDVFLGQLVPVEPAPEVKPVRLGVVGRVSSEPLLLASESGA